jgi:hypothetical protein
MLGRYKGMQLSSYKYYWSSFKNRFSWNTICLLEIGMSLQIGAYSSKAPDPTFAFVRGPCCPTLDFVIAFWTIISFYTLLTSLFCTLQIGPLFLFCDRQEVSAVWHTLTVMRSPLKKWICHCTSMSKSIWNQTCYFTVTSSDVLLYICVVS